MKAGTFKPALCWIAAIILLAGCAAVQEGLSALEKSDSGAGAVVKTAQALRKSFSEITEEEEYYIGRAVAALILSRYKIYEDEKLTAYVNRVGKAVAVHSHRPETYAGYHFLILEAGEVNALAAPGGFIFVTTGLLKRCANEDVLAGILAHEIGHVSAKHGLQAIKKSRLIDAFKIIGEQAGKRYGPGELAQLTGIFENVLGDITEKLIERGYDRKCEYEADRLGVRFTAGTGYSPSGLADFLKALSGITVEGSAKGWFKTHPAPQERLAQVEAEIHKLGPVPSIQEVRTSRFREAVSGLK